MSILEILLTIVIYLIKLPLSLVPIIDMPSTATSSMDALFSMLATIGYFVPLPTIAQILTLCMSFYIIRVLLNSVHVVLVNIPFVGFKGINRDI